ncbi:MAG: hypothetical protein ACUVQG_12670 [Thermogutta sp.]
MASPFKIFRKNAKVLLVGLFLLSMVSFVVIPSFLQWLQTRQRTVVKSVVTTKKFGELSEMELHTLWIEHTTVRRFLESLGQKIDELRGNSFRIRYYLAVLGEANEEQLVRNWLLSQYAQAAGVQITDRVVNAFIRGLIDASGVGISQNDLAQLLVQNHLEEGTLFAGLGRELLVLRYLQLAGFDLLNLQPGFAGETPAMRWEYFLRFNRMASVELCGIPVERYFEKTRMPDEREIREYFEQFKTRLPDPSSPDPGFKVPAKVTLECLKADFQKWLVNIKLTDEELRNYYEQHKDEFFLRSTPAASTGTKDTPTTFPTKNVIPSGPIVPTPGPGATKAADNSTKTEGMTPNGNQDAVKPTEGMQPEETQPSQKPLGQSEANETQPKPKSSGNESSSDHHRATSFHLVAYTEAAAAAEANDVKPTAKIPPSDKTSSETGSNPKIGVNRETGSNLKQSDAAGEAPDQGDKSEAGAPEMVGNQGAAASAGEETPAVEATQTGPGKPGQSSIPADNAEPSDTPENGSGRPTGESQAMPEQEGPVVVSPAAPEQPAANAAQTATQADQSVSKYLPFEEVKDRVRALIISERMRQALDELEEEMRNYQMDWANFQTELEEAKKQKRPLPEKPALPNLQKLAKEKQIDYVRIDEADIWTLSKRDVGKSFDTQGVPFPRAIFDLREFFAVRTFDAEQNQYLAWSIVKTEEYVPDLDAPGVRDNVIRTWRLAEARKIANRELATLAETIAKQQKSLDEFRAAHPELDLPEVVQTEPFSWLTFGEFDLARLSMPQPRLSPIKVRSKDPASGLIVEKDAVEDIGNDFMAAVFSLGVGEVGQAWNRPKSIVCLVRIIELQPPLEQLRERFFRQAEPSYLAAGQFDLNEMGVRWIRTLEEEAGLKWNRAPYHRVRE